jgi:hypothetical protein
VGKAEPGALRWLGGGDIRVGFNTAYGPKSEGGEKGNEIIPTSLHGILTYR